MTEHSDADQADAGTERPEQPGADSPQPAAARSGDPDTEDGTAEDGPVAEEDAGDDEERPDAEASDPPGEGREASEEPREPDGPPEDEPAADEHEGDDETGGADAAAADEPSDGGDAGAEPAAGAPEIDVRVFGRTDVGQIREHNEDNLLMADLSGPERGGTDTVLEVKLGEGGALLAVCDGMGGAAAGEIASQLAVDIVYDKMLPPAARRDRDRLAMAMVEALEFAGVRILAESNKNRACRGMGTTATVAALVDDVLLLGQVGDSRGYILRDERLVQVTRDQSLVNQLIEAGQLTEEEAENFEHSNIILQALGTADAVQVDLTYAELCRGDILLLCSDGLSGMIRDDEIRDIMLRSSDPVEMCRLLIDEANEAGGHDNITAVIAVFEGAGLRVADTEDTLALRYQKYPLPTWMDHRQVDAGLGLGFGSAIPYDDTPHIEIHGEIELGPHDDWDDLFDDSPNIPTERGANWSTFAILVAVIGILIAVYFLSR